MQDYISEQAKKLKIKPNHLEICKSIENGWYAKVKYSYGRQEKLNRIIKEEQLNRLLKGFKSKERQIIINAVLKCNKILAKKQMKIKIL